jgi:Carboxypeptidase regulatory-like domain/TonB dependent receptor
MKASPRQKIFAPTLIVLLLTAMPQAQNSGGSLRGTVQDATGARIASANIVARLSSSGVRREAVTEDRGEFRLDDLPPGNYQITITAAGFEPAKTNVSIAVASSRDISVTMKPFSLQETVRVQAESSSITTQPIDLASAVHQGVVTGHDLETLPLAARSFANIAYLVPGTEPVEPSDPTKARITAVSTGGSSGLNNELSVDGADNSDDWIGGFLQNFSPDAIQEFALRTAGEDADSGGTTAGSVVITTRRGTNEWHGSGAFYERAAALNARFPIENPPQTCTAGVCTNNPKQPFSRQNYVATLGGPLKNDKLWFFSSFEYVHENASIAYSPNSTAQFTALAQLASDGLIPGVSSIAVPQNVPIPFRDSIGSLRFDWSQSSKSQWFLRSSGDNYITHNALVQQATLPSTGLTTHNNYWNAVVGNTYAFNSKWLGTFLFDANALHLTQTRNLTMGFALAFPFSSTSATVSGFETFGDNQFRTPITLFPSLRNQEKYQLRYDVSHQYRDHALKFGINFIPEPVLGGAFPGNQETLYTFPNDPTFYLSNPGQFTVDYAAGAATTPASNGSFSQNIQRLALYAEDSWRVTQHLTVNYGVRYQTTFGLFMASGRGQAENPSYPLLPSLGFPLSTPHDDRKQFGPRIGIAYAPGSSGKTVLRAGFGLFYNDLAQNGWATAFQAVNGGPNPAAALIDPNYKTPYALHATTGMQHAFNANWSLSADYTHEEGNHSYRAYPFASAQVFRSDNRSSYNAFMLHLQGNVTRRFNLTANYTLAHAQTWGCVLGELFDYVNGVCDPQNAFAPGDYGPSGEDVRHRFVLAGTFHLPAGFELTTLTQAESARPYTITTVDGSNRISVNGVKTPLDAFRGTPYIQADVRVGRPINLHDRWEILPFIEFFNLFNRNNPGANFVANVGALTMVPVAEAQAGNITDLCTNAACTTMQPISSLNQLRTPGGALGDFFGPGTTVGIPFAAQLGVRLTF